MNHIHELKLLECYIMDRLNQLENIESKYLNDAGKAAIKAYQSILWYIGENESLDALVADEEYLAALKNPYGNHEEYINVLTKIHNDVKEYLKSR